MGASLDISWEADLWGRIKSSQEAALADLQSSESALEYVRKSLIAQGSKAYFLSIEALMQEDYAQNVYKNYAKSLEISQAFFDEGAVSIQDVHLAKSELATSLSALEDAKDAKFQAIRSLEILMGKYPAGKFSIPNKLSNLPKAVAAGIPATILEKRPDMVAADRKVAASFSRTTSAKAARLPRIALTASVGGGSTALSEIANPANLFWNVAGNLVAPVFDGGSRKADVEIATAEQEEAVANYKKSALKAFSEVETSLSREQILLKRFAALKEAAKQAQLAENIAATNYQQGEGNLLDLQQLQRSTIYANIELIHLWQEILSERVNLYLALGY
jgi:NodT family efflux transporter outer membrane factor (OMF) lipoprotein